MNESARFTWEKCECWPWSTERFPSHLLLKVPARKQRHFQDSKEKGWSASKFSICMGDGGLAPCGWNVLLQNLMFMLKDLFSVCFFFFLLFLSQLVFWDLHCVGWSEGFYAKSIASPRYLKMCTSWLGVRNLGDITILLAHALHC